MRARNCATATAGCSRGPIPGTSFRFKYEYPEEDDMRETYVEFMDHEVLVYFPGTTQVAITTPSLEEALAFARAEWPDLGVRVVLPKDACDFITQCPPKCPQCC